MSAAPALARIVEAAEQPVRPQPQLVTDVSALPSVWDLDAKVEWLVPDMIQWRSRLESPKNQVDAILGNGEYWIERGPGGQSCTPSSTAEFPISRTLE